MSAQPPLRLVAISGNVQRPSRSRALAELIARRIEDRIDARTEQYDIYEFGACLGSALTRAALDPEAAAVVEAIEGADILVVATPVYKGSYAGLLKHLFDFVDANALIGRPVVIAATGGSARHSLVVEHQLRPLFGFFAALTVPTGIYAEDSNFRDYELIDPGILARVELAASQAAQLVAARAGEAQARRLADGPSNVVNLKAGTS